GGAGLGGAIFNMFGSVTLVNCTVYSNTAQGGAGYGSGGGYGGAIFNLDGTVALTNDTFASNNVGEGSAISAGGGYDAGAVFCLAFGNTLTGGAQQATVTATNCIFAGSGPTPGTHEVVIDRVNGLNTNTATFVGNGPNIAQTAPVGVNGGTVSGTAATVA